ncbi:7431_t:CDS:2, partial [Dentiscutata erythropus]
GNVSKVSDQEEIIENNDVLARDCVKKKDARNIEEGKEHINIGVTNGKRKWIQKQMKNEKNILHVIVIENIRERVLNHSGSEKYLLSTITDNC